MVTPVMRFLGESHLFAETILRNEFPSEHADLMDVLQHTRLPLRASGPFTATGTPLTPKRQRMRIGGAAKRALFPIDQDSLNQAIAEGLRLRGWDTQPIAVPGSGWPGATADIKLKGDFVKNGVFVEVEFGNTASTYRDLFKFQIANRAKAGEVAVLVTGTRRMMKFCDQGVTTFESAIRLLPYLRVGIQMPIWIIGIEPFDWSQVQARYGEMQSVAEDNGIECYDFTTVFGSPVPVEAPGDDRGASSL